jgi:hypothetical protein
MNVRKASATTLSLVVLIIGLCILFPIIMRSLPYEAVYTLADRFHPQYYFSRYFPFIVKIAIWIIIAAGLLDAIMRHKIAFGLFSSLNVPFMLCIPVFIITFIPPVNPYMFWGAMQVIAIIGVYWTFRKLIRNNHSGGQKLIAFIKEIGTGGGSHSGHISGHYAVFCISILLIAVCVLLIISMLLFVVTHRNALLMFHALPFFYQ